jgi:hypothetical protein
MNLELDSPRNPGSIAFAGRQSMYVEQFNH